MNTKKKFFIREVLPLLLIVVVVAVITIVPYLSNRAELARVHKNEVYECKLNSVLREFAETAADARYASAKFGNKKLKANNLKTARVYIHVRNELRHLPALDCKQVLGIKGN